MHAHTLLNWLNFL